MIPTSSARIHWALMNDALTGVTRAAREHGDVVMHRIGRTRLVQLTHPDDIQTLLHARYPTVRKSRVVRGLSAIVGEGLLTADGDVHKTLKKPAAPLFTPRNIDGWAERMCAIARGARPASGDVLPHLTDLTLDILIDTVFGTVTGPEVRQALMALDTLLADFEVQTYTWKRLLPEFARPSARKRRLEMKRILRQAVDTLVARRRETPEGNDLLSKILHLPAEQIYTHLLTLLVAGHETTALTVSFALHHLAGNPSAVARIRHETGAIGGPPRKLKDLGAMPFTTASIQETLRLTPAVFGMGREICEPLALRNHTLEPGMQVVTPQWVVHRDPRWWTAPETWDPSRFVDAEKRPRYAYFPFGGGPRVCIGNHFAMLEAVVLVTSILERFDVSEPRPLTMRPTLTLRPADGVRLTITPRMQAEAA